MTRKRFLVGFPSAAAVPKDQLIPNVLFPIPITVWPTTEGLDWIGTFEFLSHWKTKMNFIQVVWAREGMTEGNVTAVPFRSQSLNERRTSITNSPRHDVICFFPTVTFSWASWPGVLHSENLLHLTQRGTQPNIIQANNNNNNGDERKNSGARW